MRPDHIRGVAALLLALLPAYCSLEGLVTGDTRAVARHTDWHTGAAGIVTAIAYGVLAAALVLAAVRYFSTNAKRRKTLFKWGWNVMIAGALLYFLGRFAWLAR
jgi:hypothetical protein